MEKTKRTIAGPVAYICKKSVILFLAIIASIGGLEAQCPMVCHNVNLSLDTIKGGKTTVTPEMILTNPGACSGGSFTVELFDPQGNSIMNMVNCQWVGYTLIVKVTDNISKNLCWSKIKVEDKSGPNLTCRKDTISCLKLTAYSQGLDKFPGGIATDNCGIGKIQTISLVCQDLGCNSAPFIATCQRTIIAIDFWGLTSQCTDSLWITTDSLKNVITARDTAIDVCIADTLKKDANGNPAPERVGVPTIKGVPVWPNYSVCKIVSRYSDLVYPVCGKARKIRRQWTITDWCTKKDTVVLQWIRIIDNTPPVVSWLADYTGYANPHDCNAIVDLTKPVAKDCNGIKDISYTATVIRNGVPSVISGSFAGNIERIYLPSGKTTIHYSIVDSCLNTTPLDQVVNIIDNIPPTPVCDERTATTLDPTQCWSRVYAADLDNGSHDNCCNTLYFAAIAMDTLTKYQTLLNAKLLAKFGADAYNANRAAFDLLVDKYINCAYFNEWVDLTKCGNVQVVLRVYEACKLPLYDPHVNADPKHVWFCKAAYGSPNGYSNDLGFVNDLIDRVLRNKALYGDDLKAIKNLTGKNYNDCMVWINVADKQPPVCVVDPIVTFNCDGTPEDSVIAAKYAYSISTGCDQPNGIYNPTYLKLDKYDTGDKLDPYSLFDEAKITDNCGSVKIEVSTSGSTNNCGSGTFIRTWKGTDQCGQLSTTCSQTLILKHRSDFEVVFPADIETDCLENLPNIITPTGNNYPKILDDDCETIGISYEDTKYQIATDACYKIIRTWKLIDWCQYNPDQHKFYPDYIVDTTGLYRANNNPSMQRYCTFRWLKDNGDGYLTYTQMIKVINKKAPAIAKSDSVVTCADNAQTCLGHVKLKMSGTDDCTKPEELKWTITIDLDNNGSIDKTSDVIGATASLDADMPIGKHLITFLLKDLCGNETKRASLVDVKLCKKPTPYLLNGIAIELMPIDNNKDGKPDAGMVTVWAKDFDAGSYASCGQKIVAFSFSSDTTKKSVTYTCDSIGQRFVNIWVTDSYGNQDFARTYILVQDNNKACTGGTVAILTGNINGLVKTEDKIDVEQVNVSLDGGNAVPSITKSDGVYAFNNMQIGGSYTISPKKDINPLNGVSTLDLILIQKHILGLQLLNSPYKIIAADANKSGDVSSIDLVELRKLILGVYETLPGVSSWRFIPSEFKFSNTANPFDSKFPETKSIASFTKNEAADFVGIKVGDVNGSVTANQLMGSEVRSPGKSLTLFTEEQSIKSNDMIRVPVYGRNMDEVQGYQFTISFDKQSLQYMGVTTEGKGMSQANFGTNHLDEGIITTSYSSNDRSDKNTLLFTLRFKAVKSHQLSDAIHISSKLTVAEAYSNAQEVMGVKLDVGSNKLTGEYALMQNTPNPFNQVTNVGFTLPQAANATFSIYDVNGRTVKKMDRSFASGYNEISIYRNELPASGVYYYQLQTASFRQTKKMVVLE